VACELLKKGVALETISRILDHSSIAITHAIYAKQSQSAIDDALGQL
jgi:site-specific recombinase XerD